MDYAILITAITGLAGPLATLMITNNYQSKQKQKEHNNSLQAIWFTKKLNAAEAIIAQDSLLLASIFSINQIVTGLKFDIVNPEDNDRNFDTFRHFEIECGKGLERSSQLDTVLANSLFLYFNVTERESLALQGLIKSMFEVFQDISSRIKIVLKSNPGSSDRQGLNESLDHFTSEYNQLKSAIEGQMKKIRDSFKVYDI